MGSGGYKREGEDVGRRLPVSGWNTDSYFAGVDCPC